VPVSNTAAKPAAEPLGISHNMVGPESPTNLSKDRNNTANVVVVNFRMKRGLDLFGSAAEEDKSPTSWTVLDGEAL